MEDYKKFRKGNYVFLKERTGPCQIIDEPRDGSYWVVKSVKLSNYQFSQEGEDFILTIEELKPIPVYGDDELIKFGFVEKNGSWNKDDFHITKDFINGLVLIKYIDKDTELTIRFIHELQNLYFDKKGETLEIKL